MFWTWLKCEHTHDVGGRLRIDARAHVAVPQGA